MMRKAIFAWLLISLIAIGAFAQSSTTATVRGKVTKEDGSGIGKAEIRAVNVATGFVQSTRAGSDGGYVLAGITPGDYVLTVAAPGFEPRTENVTVRVRCST